MITLTSTLVLAVLSFGPFGGYPRGAEIVDFNPELDALSEGPACDGSPQREGPFQTILEGHCEKVRTTVEKWKTGWLPKASPFFQALVPKDLPREVVYPFGGADLLSALFVYPDARVITIMALEPGGDPRSLSRLEPAALKGALGLVRRHFDFLLRLQFSQTVDLDELIKGPLAGVLIYDLAALGILGYEPTRLRYFELGPTGGRLYFDRDMLAAIDAEASKIKNIANRNKFLSKKFSNFEITFRKKKSADNPHPPEQVFRHLAVDLEDGNLRRDKRLLLHLRAKGEVSAIIKAASNLLWWTSFSEIRNYLIENAVWTISDSSGVATSDLDQSRFVQETWGKFDGPPFPSPDDREKAVIALWASNPERPLDFFFGYHSKGGFPHLMVTRRL
jgi:hypothetical protein